MRNRGAVSDSGGFVITRLVLMESGVYNERFLRALKIGTITQETVDRLSEDLMLNNGQTFTPGAIADIRTPPITLEENIDHSRDSVELARGWDSKRFCFIMQIVEEGGSIHSADRTYTVSGYTDRLEFSKYTKAIPDDLEFFVNNILETSNNGRCRGNLQVFTDANFNSTTEKLFMLRPSDVISKHAYTNMNIDGGRDFKRSYTGDQVSGKSFQPNSRQNTIGTNYLSKALSGVHKVRMEGILEKNTRGDDYEDENHFFRGRRNDNRSRAREIETEYERSRLAVREPSAEEYEFILQLKDLARDTQRVGSFKFKQLKRFCPEIENFIDVNLLQKNSLSDRFAGTLDRVGNMDGEEWGSAMLEELIATNVTNAFTAIASSCYVVSIDLIFTLVDDGMGEWGWEFEVGVEDDFNEAEASVIFFDDVNEELEQEFIDKVGYTLIDSVLNQYKRVGYDLFVSIEYNMNREVFVKVAVDDDKAVERCSAIFCDGLVSSNLTTRERSGVRMGESITELYKEVYRNVRN